MHKIRNPIFWLFLGISIVISLKSYAQAICAEGEYRFKWHNQYIADKDKGYACDYSMPDTLMIVDHNGIGAKRFTYWQKEGFGVHQSCKHPGQEDYEIKLAQNEASNELCGSNFSYEGELPDRYLDCRCHEYNNGCEDEIAAIRELIDLIENNPSIDPIVKEWLIAYYERCLDNLMRSLIKSALVQDEAEDAITFLSVQPEFRYQSMSYGIMNHLQQYTRSRSFLNALPTANEEQEDFVTTQNIYLDYITDIDNFVLSAGDRLKLESAGLKNNTLAGYARSIYYRLTGDKIEFNLPHIDGSITPRSTDLENTEIVKKNELISIYPNPANNDFIQISISDFDPSKHYSVNLYNLYGKHIAAKQLSSDKETINIDLADGIYIVTISINGLISTSQKLIKL